MPSFCVVRRVSAGLLAVLAMAACSSNDEGANPGAPPSPAKSTGAEASSTSDGAAGVGGASEPASAMSDGGGGALDTASNGTTSAADGDVDGGSTDVNYLGNVTIVDEPDVACTHDSSAVPIEIYPASANPSGFARLEMVGSRRVAWTSFGSGFTLFDAIGANANPTLTSVADSYNFATSEGATVGLAGVTSDSVYFRRYDASGAAAFAPLGLGSTNGTGLLIGGSAGASLVAWGQGDAVQAVGVSEAGNVGVQFTFGAGTIGSYVKGSIAPATGGFAVAWTGEPVPNMVRTSFALTSATGLTKPVVQIATSSFPHQLVKMVKTPGGYALLFNGDFPSSTLYVLAVDGNGKVLGPAHRLLGGQFGWDLAAQGDKLGVLALKDTGEAVFRPLDASGAPLGPWLCFAGPSPNDLYITAALQAAGAGYEILYRGNDGAVDLTAVDALGAAVP